MALVQLPPTTIKLITSTQIITSVSSAVKELMENSLDAGATNIDVKLVNNGIDRLEVKDNGSGISRANTACMALPHYTSKISEFRDLESLHTYGFRGEALNALCHVAQVNITTATSSDPVAMSYTLDSGGSIVDTKPSHFTQGTTVVVSNLFKNLPVRRQFLGSNRRAQDELKRVEATVKALAIIKPNIRVTLNHNKCLLWQKNSCSSLLSSFSQIIGYSLSQELEPLSSKGKVFLEMLVPKKNCDITAVCKSTPTWSFVYANQRPVTYKKILKALHQQLCRRFGADVLQKKHAVCLISISADPSELDVNLEPNKTQVLVSDEDVVIGQIERLLKEYYGTNSPATTDPASTSEETSCQNVFPQENRIESDHIVKKRKLDEGAADIVHRIESNSLEEELGVSEIDLSDTQERNHINERRKVPEHSVEVDQPRVLNSAAQQLQNVQPQFVRSTTEYTSAVKECNLYPHHGSGSDDFGMRTSATGYSGSVYTADIKSTNMQYSDSVQQCSEKRMNDQQYDFHETEQSSVCYGTGKSVKLPSGPSTNLWDDINEDDLTHLDMFASQENPSGMTVNEQAVKGLEQGFMNHSDLSLENWSKGLVRSENGGLVQGSCVLLGRPKAVQQDSTRGAFASDFSTPEKSPAENVPEIHELNCSISSDVTNPVETRKDHRLSTKKHSPKSKDISLSQSQSEAVEHMDSSMQSVSSQMGRRELAAFTKFARDIRPQLILDNPGISFTRVATVLAEKWKALSAEDREHYEDIAKQTATNRKVWQTAAKQQKLSWGEKPVVKLAQADSSENKKQKSTRSTRPATPPSKRPPRVVVPLETSIDHLKQMTCSLNSHPRGKSTIKNGKRFMVVGHLEPSGCWVCLESGQKIHVLNHSRLQEVVISHRLLQTYKVPLVALPAPQQLSSEVLGELAWSVLLTLPHGFDDLTQSPIISADVITKNGFRVEMSDSGASLTHTAETLNFYGIKELRETLELYKKQTSPMLNQCRPLRVVTHIKGEAVRICRKAPAMMERSMVEELLEYWETVMPSSRNQCIHSKPILTELFDIRLGKRTSFSS